MLPNYTLHIYMMLPAPEGAPRFAAGITAIGIGFHRLFRLSFDGGSIAPLYMRWEGGDAPVPAYLTTATSIGWLRTFESYPSDEEVIYLLSVFLNHLRLLRAISDYTVLDKRQGRLAILLKNYFQSLFGDHLEACPSHYLRALEVALHHPFLDEYVPNQDACIYLAPGIKQISKQEWEQRVQL